MVWVNEEFEWPPDEPKCPFYLRPTGRRRRRCLEFERNPDWDGTLKEEGDARVDDPETSQDMARGVQPGCVWEARAYVDAIMALNGGTVISIELREYVMAGIEAGRIANPARERSHIRGDSIRRRFSALTGGSKT
jgi:hypothetical protein